MRTRGIPMMLIVGMSLTLLAGCISGRPHPDTYTSKSGETSVIESDREQCERTCNESYSRCMDSTGARDNGGVIGPRGIYGASAECRGDLSSCMLGCKSPQ